MNVYPVIDLWGLPTEMSSAAEQSLPSEIALEVWSRWHNSAGVFGEVDPREIPRIFFLPKPAEATR